MISVVIPTYNSAKYIKEAIDSVLMQTLQPLEIIVVDDGSTDDTNSIIASYTDLKKIIYIKKDNGGPASARNMGIKKSSGEFIALLDADDIWESDKLEKQVLLFDNKDIGLVYSRRLFLSDNRLDSGPLYSGNVTKNLLINNFITNSSVVIRKSICNQVGFFREEKRFFAIEDYDFWLRCSVVCNFSYIDSSLVAYRVHKGQISNVRRSAVARNIIKLYFFMLFDKKYKKHRRLLIFKIMQSIKRYCVMGNKH